MEVQIRKVKDGYLLIYLHTVTYQWIMDHVKKFNDAVARINIFFNKEEDKKMNFDEETIDDCFEDTKDTTIKRLKAKIDEQTKLLGNQSRRIKELCIKVQAMEVIIDNANNPTE